MSHNHPVLLTGAPGVGKTSMVQQLVLPKHTHSTLVMSHGMTAARLQASVIGTFKTSLHDQICNSLITSSGT